MRWWVADVRSNSPVYLNIRRSWTDAKATRHGRSHNTMLHLTQGHLSMAHLIVAEIQGSSLEPVSFLDLLGFKISSYVGCSHRLMPLRRSSIISSKLSGHPKSGCLRQVSLCLLILTWTLEPKHIHAYLLAI